MESGPIRPRYRREREYVKYLLLYVQREDAVPKRIQ